MYTLPVDLNIFKFLNFIPCESSSSWSWMKAGGIDKMAEYVPTCQFSQVIPQVLFNNNDNVA